MKVVEALLPNFRTHLHARPNRVAQYVRLLAGTTSAKKRTTKVLLSIAIRRGLYCVDHVYIGRL
jgi:hypothetical protein